MQYETILFERRDRVGVLTLNRPKQINALSLRLMNEVLDLLARLEQDRDLGAVVIRGAGKHFCAGHDLSEMTGRDVKAYREIFDTCTRMMNAIQALPQPVIAQVQGVATAAGCQLVATCDLAVAAEGARFATPGVKIGLFCSTPMVALSRAVGRKKALEMLLTGEFLDAEEARLFGLVNRVVPADRLADETLALARKVTQASPLTLGIGKQAFYNQIDLPQPQAYAYAKEVMSLNALAADAQEGMCAFLEKRDPRWTGR
ncbi:enoyl-CoA hydratase [Deferrisoma camini]|uniref:enoyl-CoA hydratase n=1 Tax=Deferrisoma camini TaxID=1035120 RepID=UPI00046CECAB|nr:enoyl-CoA hydratase [Deferrisoma camini]